MTKFSIVAALGLCLVGTLPAHAVMCIDNEEGAVVTFGFQIGADYTESEKNNLDLMRLRQMGVDATAVERWGGCIRAFVRKPGGGEEMQFFMPGTLRRVE